MSPYLYLNELFGPLEIKLVLYLDFCVTFKKAFISNQAEHFISVIVDPLLLWDEENGTLGETFHHSTYRYNIVIFAAPPYGFIIVIYRK